MAKKGKKFTEEHIEKLRESHLGYKMPQSQKEKISKANKGKNVWTKGSKHKDETKKKMSIAHKGEKHSLEHIQKVREKVLGQKRPSISGENNYRWIKDRTKLKKSEKKHLDGQYRDWMKQVKDRDGWKCKLLSSECNGRLEAHHIFNWLDYPQLRYVLTNGVTLCRFHHPIKWSEEIRMIPIFQEIISKE